MTPDEYLAHDATSLAELIRTRQVSRDEVLAAARRRIAACNPAINAVIDLYETPVEDSGVDGAPFAGVPFLLKDIGAGIAGKRTTSASRVFAESPVRAVDDELTRRFRAAGLRIIGKTNLPEMGFNVTSEPLHFGPVRNPFDLSRSAGGSSGGSAAAVAAGMVAIAHATDGAGSIRIPAACCGLVGLKPSRGAIPQGPTHADIYGGLVSEGLVSRTVRDSTAAFHAMRGADAGAPYAAPPLLPVKSHVRIGVLSEAADDCPFDADSREALARAAESLADAGHHVAEVGPFLTPEDWRIPRLVYLTQACAQGAADFHGLAIPGNLEQINRAAIARGRAMAATDYLTAQRRGHDFARRFVAIWSKFDVLLMPALSGAAPKLGQYLTGHDDVSLHVDRMTRLAPFAGTFNLTGGPAIVVSAMQNSAGLPVGVQMAADIGGDLQLLVLAGQIHRLPDKVPL